MGFELTCFVDEIDQEFICSICMMVVENPTETPCEHIFCCSCIKGWVPLEAKCPVDRQTLRLTDLKPTRRYYRNLLNKLKIRCEMEPLGCRSIVPLENHKIHLNQCEYKPNAIVVCDKGCNIEMTRLEYQDNCIKHITKLFGGELEELRLQLEKLNYKMKRQREVIVRLLSRENAPTNLFWKNSRNMKTTLDEPYILEPECTSHFSWAFAQFPRLTATNPSFKIHVLSVFDDEYVIMGLTHHDSHDVLPGSRVGSIGYYNRGELVVDNTAEFGFVTWKNGDIVECGIDFQNVVSLNADYGVGVVHFSVNEQIVVKKKMKIPIDGLYPTIRMGTFADSVPKIEYLTC